MGLAFFLSQRPPGTSNDIDVYLLDDPPTRVLAQSNDVNVGGDAVEAFRFENPVGSGVTKFNILITRFSGPNPGFMKYVLVPQFLGTINEFNTRSGTVFGHRNAAGAETVGGAFFGNTPEFGVDPALLWPFSSAGPTPILFDIAGKRLPRPEIRRKPEVVAPTGTNTTFFGEDIPEDPDTFPNFFGTSASAPHAAGVAALMLDRNSSLSPATIYTILENTADEMLSQGFDFDSGFGLIQANLAVKAVPLTSISCNGLTATIFGTNGNDIIEGTAARDIINGRGGRDTINGLGGNDVICGGTGDDILRGGRGNDRLFGGEGNDKLDGGNGIDICNGGVPNNTNPGDTQEQCERVINVP